MNERKSFQKSNSNTSINENETSNFFQQYSKKKFNRIYSKNIKSLKNKNGITLIALVISIIVMLILAGVSLNATIGDNGIITQAQNATYMQSIAALEEYLQTEYVKYYDETENYTSKIELLSSKLGNLCLKDGTKNYITYDGKMYYLINKQALPDEVKNQLRGGDTTEYLKYIRLQDVYGVTPDLKVYYCESGTDSALGTLDSTELDPSTPLKKINQDAEMKSAITEALASVGVTVGEDGVTVGDASKLKNVELDGSKHNITSISGLSELSSLKTVTLSNLNLNDLDGLQNCTLLYYVYFKNCKVNDYSKLSTVLDLQYLYLYLPPSMSEADANAQVTNLGNGLANATEMNKLEYFGIVGVTTLIDEEYSFNIGNSKNKWAYVSNVKSNVTNIDDLAKISENIKKTIKYVYMNNNSFSSIEALKGFKNIYELDIMNNSNLLQLNGFEDNNSITYIFAQNCNLQNIEGLEQAKKLKYLGIIKNTNLSSLKGLENLSEIDTIRAMSCNITDISALKDNTSLQTLNIEGNTNLRSVIALKNCTGIRYLYLNGNNNMIGTEVRDALADANTHIIQNCGTNYRIPSKYSIYFSNLTSYDYSDLDLSDDSDEINSLKNKTNVTRLNLNGNPNLSNSKLQEILSTMTGLKYLTLKDCTNLSTLDFVGKDKVTQLVELDVRNTNLVDLSNLNNNATNLSRLFLNNYNINIENMQTTLNRVGKVCGTDAGMYVDNNGKELPDAWNGTASYSYNGLHLDGDLSKYDFSRCKEIEYFTLRSSDNYGILDLSNCSNLKYMDYRYCNGGALLPESLISFDSVRVYGNISFVSGVNTILNLKNLNIMEINEANATTIVNNLGLKNLQKLKLSRVPLSSLNILDKFDASTVEYIFIGSDGELGNPIFKNLNGIQNLKNVKEVKIQNCPKLENIDDLSQLNNIEKLTINLCRNVKELPIIKSTNVSALNISNTGLCKIQNINVLTSLKELVLYNNQISDISVLSNLKNLTKLNLNDNNISDVAPLIGMIENNKIKFNTLNLSNNLLQTVTVDGKNNIEALKTLYNAGLRNLDISGNNFTAGSTDELKSFKWTSYKE